MTEQQIEHVVRVRRLVRREALEERLAGLEEVRLVAEAHHQVAQVAFGDAHRLERKAVHLGDDERDGVPRAAPPRAGQDSDAVLEELLDIGPEERARLRGKGII